MKLLMSFGNVEKIVEEASKCWYIRSEFWRMYNLIYIRKYNELRLYTIVCVFVVKLRLADKNTRIVQ